MRTLRESTKSGKFSLAAERAIYGELRVAGSKTSLYLQDNQIFSTRLKPGDYVTGILNDLTRVTLVQCLTLGGLGSSRRNDEQYYFVKVFPHFVLEGQQHLDPNDRAIVQVRLVIDDAAALFCDFDAFGIVMDAAPHIEGIVAANKPDVPITIGSKPQIAYFAGRRNIAEVETVLGKVRVWQNPRFDLVGPRGVRMSNTISVIIDTEPPVLFKEAISRTLRLLRFLELIIGRSQNLQELVITINTGKDWEPLKVHWSHCPARSAGSQDDDSAPQGGQLPLDPVQRSEEFARVLRAWLEKDEDRREARQRFEGAFAQPNYSVDRLVGAANMFDILPDSAVPKAVELPEELRVVKDRCRAILKDLPQSYERDSVLNALGWLGKASLKHKTRHRANYVFDSIGEQFPELLFVVDEAINCRNHFVHGSPCRIDYGRNSELVVFLTNTLEFVFAASELVEAGWNIRTFMDNRASSRFHPFVLYRDTYQYQLETLKALIAGNDNESS